MRALILAALLAACLAHVVDSATPLRSLVVDDFPADSGMCRESLVTLCLCKRDLLASFLTGSPVPRVCCGAAEDVDFHCGPFIRAFVGLLLPRGLLLQCAASTGARPSARAPPRVPSTAIASPRVSSAARAPPGPEAYTSVRFPPPRTTEVSGGARAPPAPEAYTSVRSPPPRTTQVSGGVRPPPAPEGYTSVRFPPPRTTEVSGGARAPPAPEAYTSVRFPPPRTTRVSSGMRAPPGPEAYTTARFPPPRTAKVSGGTPAPPKPKHYVDVPETRFRPHDYVPGVGSVYLPPPYPQTASRATSPEAHTSVRPPPPPRAAKAASTGTHDAVVAGAHDHEVRGAPAVPVYSGSAGGSDAPKPKVATAPPRSGARTASPIPDSLSYGTPL